MTHSIMKLCTMTLSITTLGITILNRNTAKVMSLTYDQHKQQSLSALRVVMLGSVFFSVILNFTMLSVVMLEWLNVE
jgi:hypothetical protein